MNINFDRIKMSLSDLAAIYVLLWTITPALASGSIYRILLIGCVCLWTISKITFIYSQKNTFILMILLLVGYFVTQFLSHGLDHAISWTINMGIYVIVALIGMYFNYKKRDAVPVIVTIMLIIIVVVSIISIKTVIMDPYALRRATYSLKDRGHSYGAYSFIYMMTQLVPFLVFVLLLQRNIDTKLNKSVVIATILIGWTLLIMSGFTIANVVVIIASLLFVMFSNFNIRKALIIIVFISVFILTYRHIFEFIFSVLKNATSGNLLYERKIQDLYNQIILGHEAGASYVGRLDLYRKSWSTLIDYPILGSAVCIGMDPTGGHSTLIDIMANNGLFVALLYYWLIFKVPIKMMKRMDPTGKYKYVIGVFVFLIVSIGTFNTLTYTCAWVWFLLIPYLLKNSSTINIAE